MAARLSKEDREAALQLQLEAVRRRIKIERLQQSERGEVLVKTMRQTAAFLKKINGEAKQDTIEAVQAAHDLLERDALSEEQS